MGEYYDRQQQQLRERFREEAFAALAAQPSRRLSRVIVGMQSFAERLLSLAGHTRPVYVFDAESHGVPAGRYSLAFVSPALDLAAQSTLEAAGRWQGRGFAIGINSQAMLTRLAYASETVMQMDIAGIVTHEVAHLLDLAELDSIWLRHPRVPADLVAEVVDGWRADAESQLVAEFDEKKSRHEGMHGPKWCRNTLHLARAAAEIGQPLCTQHLVPLGFSYPKLNAALGSEFEIASEVPLPVLMSGNPPAEFVAAWESEVADWTQKHEATETGAGISPASTH